MFAGNASNRRRLARIRTSTVSLRLRVDSVVLSVIVVRMKRKTSANKNSSRPFSGLLVHSPEAPPRTMLYPIGFTEEDFKKPLIGIASTWSNVTPCNMHIDKLALEADNYCARNR